MMAGHVADSAVMLILITCCGNCSESVCSLLWGVRVTNVTEKDYTQSYFARFKSNSTMEAKWLLIG